MKMKQHLLFLLWILPVFVWGNIGPAGFHAFNQNRVFVETGTYGGRGIQLAIEAGFKEIYSCDINEAFVKRAQERFRKNKHVHISLRDSSSQLIEIINDIHEPITFWLDAHIGFPDPNAVGMKNTPLMEELDQIKRHPIKSHIILIDDLHCCETLLFDYLTLDDIISKVLEINPAYTITFVDGGNEGEYPNNVLVALPPKR